MTKEKIKNVLPVSVWKILRTVNCFRYNTQKKLKQIFRRFESDKSYIKRKFLEYNGYPLNLENPRTFNEKLNWLKLHDRNPKYIKMVDKYEVKKYVADRIGEEYIIPTIGIYNKFNDIDFSLLPPQFVLKCTHDSGSVIICTDKNVFDKESANKKLSSALKKNYYLLFREWVYKNVKPRIIAEKYLCKADGIDDYKVMCFNGEPKIIQVHKNRFSNHTQDFYDVNWNRLGITQGETLNSSEINPSPPLNFNKMLKFSALLSQGIPFVRIDWFDFDGKLFFGEITFFDAAGLEEFQPKEWNLKLGELINLKRKDEE